MAAATTVTGLWIGDRGVFDADVRVCAPVLSVGPGASRPDTVRVWSGPDVADAAPVAAASDPSRWSELLARAGGVPVVAVGDAGSLGSWCEATAGFRAQFYGLAPHTVDLAQDGEDGPAPECPDPGEGPAGSAPLVTVGMIEPLACRWGSGTAYRYAGRRWIAPAVDVAALAEADPTLARWVRDRLEPKVLVATQTKVVEAVVDREGRWIPSTPVIAVTAPPERLGHLAAALTSPVATAAALARTAGSALSGDTIKLSARQVLALPTPVDLDAWDDGAHLVAALANGAVDRAEGLAELGRVMIAAAGRAVDDPEGLFAWWWSRMPLR